MAEINSPISGGIRAVRRNVSSNIFTGGGVIKQKQDSVASNATFRNSVLLGNISKQVDNVSAQTGILNKALQVISANLATSSALDRKRQEANARREQQLIEGGLRDGKERAIENNIQKALMAPIKKIGAKVQLGLGKLVNVFFILTGGWLINKTIDMLRALSGDNQEKFVKIRNDLIKGLLIITGTVALFTAAFGGLGLGLGKLGIALATVALGGMLGNPLMKLKNAIFGTANKAKDMVGGAAPSTTGGSKSTTTTPGKGNTKSGIKPKGGGLAAPSKFSLFITTMFGAKNVLEGKPFQYEVVDQGLGYGAASVGGMLGSKVPGPAWFKALAGVVTSIIFFNEGYKFRGGAQDAIGEKKLTELQEDLESGGISPGMMSPITDEDLLYDLVDQRPRREDFKIGGSGTREYKRALEEFEAANGARILELKGRVDAQKNETNIDPVEKQEAKIEPSTTKKEQTKNLSKELGSLEEPSPSIIPFPSGGEGADPNAVGGNVAAGGVGGGVPVIPASNKDNSYVFLAFKNYQVVPG